MAHLNRSTRLAILSLALALCSGGPAAAQVPNVASIFPPGGQAGTRQTITLAGGNLQGTTQILASGAGVEYQITKNTEGGSLPVDISIAADALPGLRELRVATPRGTSNAGRIWVGSYPETNETEPNNTLETKQALEGLPLTINGAVNGAEDVDTFTFHAEAGDTYVFDLVANRMVSGLDGYLSLTDERGKSLRYAQEAFDRDPRIIHTFKTAGTYVIQVRDTLYRGGPGYAYKLTVGKVPVVTGYLPRSGKRGQTVNVQIEGVNLGEMRSMAVPIPMDDDEVTMVPATPGGPSLTSISLRASDLDPVVETEPNDTIQQTTAALAVPAAISGRIDRKGDLDYFRIKAAAAGSLTFDLFARRIGSRIEPILTIYDAAGKQLQQNDDADGKDSRFNFTVEAGAEYIVMVRSQDHNFGSEAFYRLDISPPAGQDFRLTVTPDEINVGQSGSTAVTVNVTRAGGFNAPISLRVDGMPEGLTMSQATVPQGQNAISFTLTAAPNASPGAMGMIRVVGTAVIAGKPVERVAQPVEVYTPPLAQENQRSQRSTYVFAAAVMPQQAYALDIESRTVTVKKGQSVEIKIKAIRQAGATQQIAITVAGQPANVNPAAQPIKANENEVILKITVANNAPAVTQNIIITGTLNNNVQVAPALTLTITD